MATIIGVGMQMTASAAGMTKGLSEADRALQLLQKIVDQNQQSLKRFSTESDKAQESLGKLTRGVSTLSTIEIGRVLVSGVQALASAFTSAGQNVLSLASSVSSSLDSLNDLSARTGIGVEALQGYSLAAKMAGVDTEQFGTAVQRLAVNIGKATPGDQLDKSLRSINLSVVELRALAPDQQFSAIANAISQLPTVADRAAVAVEIFGKQGAALAPLFREGAASIEELRARAERLGIIVSDTQVNNVADMNDAFDLVRATIEGIIGQVIGNLAPAVTDVTNQFLRFVEEWSGAQGQGGTGIANAITDVLLQGAEYFAKIFDKFALDFGGLTLQLSTVGETLRIVGNVMTAVTESLRIVFNVFEVIGNALLLGFAKLLEGIGSWVNSDLEAFGRDLANSAQNAIKQNEQDLQDAASNVAESLFGNGSDQASTAGAGAAEEYVRSMRERIEREQSPQFKIETNIEQTRERFDSFFNGIVDQESAITEAYRNFESVVASVEDPLNMTAEEIKRIEEAQQLVNTAIDQERAARQAAADASAKQADADAKRIAGLEKVNDAQAKAEEDIAAVQREQARVQQQIAAARAAGNTEAANAAAGRLAQLDQLQARLEEEQQAVEQGFGQGFAKAFAETDRGIQGLIEKAQEFGNAGAVAFQELQTGIARAQAQAQAGLLNKEAFDREVAAQRQVFEERLAAARRVEDFLSARLNDRQRAELEATKQLEDRKKQSALNLKAIEDKIAEERLKVEKARADGNLREARAAQDRIKALQNARRDEQQVGRSQLRQNVAALAQQQSAIQQSFQSAAQQQIQSSQAAATTAIGQINEVFAQAADRQRQKIRELNTLGSRTVNTADLRTQEGAALVLGLAANALDPRLVEQRLTNKILKQVAAGLSGNLNRIGVPATIL